MTESDTAQFKLNMPVGLRQRLGDASEKSGRSVTAEIIARLEKSFETDEEFSTALDNIDYLLERLSVLEEMVLKHDMALNSGAYEYD